MKSRLVIALVVLAAVAACTNTYSGYRSKCACDFERMGPAELELA
ncbi:MULTISPECIES: hypothetical protein [unclassified Ruegeria]|nr:MULTISPECIES: hypothetical protein [unclassified Ruegeria]